jgi:DinB superfamily
MIQQVIKRIEGELKAAFNEVFDWFNKEEILKVFRPLNKGWTIEEVLEHIYLTNFYLLILIRKAATSALKKSTELDYSTLLIDYDLDWNRMKVIGKHQAFIWNRPEHMQPTKSIKQEEVKKLLEVQMKDCLNLLRQLNNGQGVLHKTSMSVNNLGKIDVYHYIYFLVQHMKRHLTQMQKIEIEYLKRN